jgi:repressor LexA
MTIKDDPETHHTGDEARGQAIAVGCVAAEANHCGDKRVQSVLDAVCARLVQVLDGHTDEPRAQAPSVVPSKPRFTARQGEDLAFIHYNTKIHRASPAEADFRRYFKVTAPTVHAMILVLERQGSGPHQPPSAASGG